jgi:hypothetical protein
MISHEQGVHAVKNELRLTVTAGPNEGAVGKAKRMLILFGEDRIEIDCRGRTINAEISDLKLTFG